MPKKEFAEPLVQLIANVRYEAYKELREKASEKGISLSQAVREAVDLWLKTK